MYFHPFYASGRENNVIAVPGKVLGECSTNAGRCSSDQCCSVMIRHAVNASCAKASFAAGCSSQSDVELQLKVIAIVRKCPLTVRAGHLPGLAVVSPPS